MSYTLLEFLCPAHGRFELLVHRRTSPDYGECPECGECAPWVISAPKTKTTWGTAAERGKVEEPPPGALDTRAIADGMPTGEYMRKRREARRKERLMKLPRKVRRAVEKHQG